MVKSSKRLQTVLKLAQLRQQRAAEQLGVMTRNAQAQQQQAEQLKHYQLDYNEHFKTLALQVTNAGQLRNFQGFYRNLEQVIDTQGERVILASNQREAARAKWQQLYAREKNMQSLIARKLAGEALEEDKKQQREQDDRPRRQPQ